MFVRNGHLLRSLTGLAGFEYSFRLFDILGKDVSKGNTKEGCCVDVGRKGRKSRDGTGG